MAKLNSVTRNFARFHLLSLAIIATLTTASTQGAPLEPGDIVIPFQSSGSLYRVDPLSGAAQLITTGGSLFNPSHVLIDAQGRILNAERSGSGSIVRTDPTAGTQTVLASGSLLATPTSLAFELNGNLVVGTSPQLGSRQLVRVNPQTGSQSLLATLSGLSNIQDVDVDSQGRIVVLDAGIFNSGGGKIVRYDPATQQQSVVSSGLFNPSDLVIRPTGDFIVANRLANSTSQILRVDPVTGAHQLTLTVPAEGWIALENQNTILFADFRNDPSKYPSVIRADLLTGQTQPVSNFNVLFNAVGIAIYTPVPEPSTMMLLVIGACVVPQIARCKRSPNRS